MEKLNLKDQNSTRKAYALICLLSFLFTAGIIYLVFLAIGLAPAGGSALIHNDGQIQMIDLFCWYKDVLTGKASISYSLSKSLGGSNFAVFTYYLASPFSLLIVFFKKSQASLFMDVLFILKTSTAALMAAYYLVKRFRPKGYMRYGATIMLAVSYALCQFFICQSSNVMWLDGAYMLPLILLGCEEIVAGKKSTRFIVSAALAICFNWYTGIIDIMFSGIWFLFEMARRSFSGADASEGEKKDLEGNSEKKDIKSTLMVFVRFAVSGICAVLLSAAMLVPTLVLLSDRKHGSSGLAMLKDLRLIGPFRDVITNYSFGTVSVKGSVSLFAGSFVLIGAVLFFVAGVRALKEKLVCGVLLLFTVMLFLWQPLVAIFSIFREVEAFWYRYSYLGCFVLVFLAASFYLGSSMKKLKSWMPFAVATCFSFVVFILCRISPLKTSDYFITGVLEDLTGAYIDFNVVPRLCKIIFPMFVGIVLTVCVAARKEKPTFKYILATILSGLIFTELAAGQIILGKGYSAEDVDYIADYTEKEEDMLSRIEDEDFFRILQTSCHSKHYTLPASYNEPMAYGFYSVTSFVSDPEENTLEFLDKAGYQAHSETITATGSENLALDSLLGVRYVLLPYSSMDTQGLEFISGKVGFKNLYRNPYELPAAFAYDGTGDYDSDKTAPAEYLNDLYREFSGSEKPVFLPVTVSAKREENVLTYDVDLTDQYDSYTHILYGNLVTNMEIDSVLYINGEEYTAYSRFLAPSLFRIATTGGHATVRLEFSKKSSVVDQADVVDAQFYVLDLDALGEAVEKIRSRAATSVDIRDGKCRFEVYSTSSGQSLYTSIPSEKGWVVTCNGQKVDYDLVSGALISVPLSEGENVIEMRFEVPGKTAGIILTVAGVILLGTLIFFEKRGKKTT